MTTALAAPGTRVVNGLRANCLAALIMLLVEEALGLWVNLGVTVPASDQNAGIAAAIADAVTRGPIGLALHALLGLLIIVSGISATVRAVGSGPQVARWAAPTALGAVVVAALGGARFVGTAAAGASLVMALATVLAIFCYALILFRTALAPVAAAAPGPVRWWLRALLALMTVTMALASLIHAGVAALGISDPFQGAAIPEAVIGAALALGLVATLTGWHGYLIAAGAIGFSVAGFVVGLTETVNRGGGAPGDVVYHVTGMTLLVLGLALTLSPMGRRALGG